VPAIENERTPVNTKQLGISNVRGMTPAVRSLPVTGSPCASSRRAPRFSERAAPHDSVRLLCSYDFACCRKSPPLPRLLALIQKRGARVRKQRTPINTKQLEVRSYSMDGWCKPSMSRELPKLQTLFTVGRLSRPQRAKNRAMYTGKAL
jgi:hypothetical protein